MVRDATWSSWAPTGMLGTHVTGKRLGIFGMGRIGRAVARRARGFEMEIHYSNRRRLPMDQEAGAIFHESAEDKAPDAPKTINSYFDSHFLKNFLQKIKYEY